jgi:tetratricopeptide (TPR) repeat protein
MTELLNYISDTKNGQYNFALGRWYESQGHTAAAAGYYIRTTEFAKDELLIYEALLRISICLLSQGARVFVSKGVLLRAIALKPERPEAYFLMSQCCEHNKDFSESYTYACLGERIYTNKETPKLRTNVGYPGEYGFIFEKAVSGWWLGLVDESIHLFRQLDKRADMLPIHIVSVKNNLKNLSNNFKNPLTYYGNMYERLKVKFKGARDIERNYSQCYQDMFVLTILNGKENGKFVEIGCGDPFFGNNTALLEEFGWTGISIDIDSNITKKFAEQRTSQVITADATKLDYSSLLTGDYDYLQIDCDPALNSLQVLFRIPFEKCRFAIITFEHDAYSNDSIGIKERSRVYLHSLGYKMIVGDIAPDKYMNFEDWWIHPDLTDGVPCDLITYSGEDKTRKADEYMLNLG